MFLWMRADSSIIDALREHLSDIYTSSSIILGFALTTLIFYLPLVAQ
jgi:hypothetical protein